jgi:hypothetical protein
MLLYERRFTAYQFVLVLSTLRLNDQRVIYFLFQTEPFGSQFLCNIRQLVLLITFQHGLRRKHRSSVAVQLLLSDGMTYSIFACAAIGTQCAENTISLLLFTGRRLVTAGCDSTILALSQHATIYLVRIYVCFCHFLKKIAECI